MKLTKSFFDQEAETLAIDLLGKVIRVKYESLWLSAQIIETEAYYLHEKASHSSLGYTEKRKALFMSAGTIYMYYARGADSLNISARGEGNAVLIKSGIPHFTENADKMIELMQKINPIKNTTKLRDPTRLCSGQTLLCKSLHLKVKDWDQKEFDEKRFFIEDIHYKPTEIIQTTRLGIPIGRDEHLPLRFIDKRFIEFCSDKGKGARNKKALVRKS